MLSKIINKIKSEIDGFIPKPHSDDKKYGLKRDQVYPQGKYFKQSLKEYFEKKLIEANFKFQ